MGKIGLMWKLISVCYNIRYINLEEKQSAQTEPHEKMFFFSSEVVFQSHSFPCV